MSPILPRSTAESAGDAPTVTVKDLASRLGVSTWWVGERVRKNLIPHVRTGTPPQPGKRDTRAVSFTQAQADKIAADYEACRIEVIEPRGGAA
jgi:hypothetical protein